MSNSSIEQALQTAIQHQMAGGLPQAEAIYTQILVEQPNQPDALCLLGAIARQTGRRELAMDLLHRAIAAKPDFPDAWYMLALAQVDTGQLQQAIAGFEKAIARRPGFAEAHNNLAAAFKDDLRLDDAIAACRKAIELKPDFAEAHYNFSQIQLLRGDWISGWEEYEWRWRCGKAAARQRRFPQPLWDGSNLRGRTIFLHDEQGFGDTIQFIRYVPMVAARGGKVIVGCPPTLRRILQSIGGVDHWVVPGERVPKFDLHCPLLSLPRAFGTTPATIPGDVPYLRPDSLDAQRWQKELASDTNRLKVGLVWAGNSEHQKDRVRSMSLNTMAPLARIPAVSFYSLQKGPAAQQASNAPDGMRLIDHTAELNNFADTAALVSNLNLVISVDTAVLHLAGAIGKPVWTLLQYSPDWRWLLNRDDTPWYPTVRLFRQPAIGDWDSVISQVADAIRKIS